jgi:hypothetical protein
MPGPLPFRTPSLVPSVQARPHPVRSSCWMPSCDGFNFSFVVSDQQEFFGQIAPDSRTPFFGV